MKIAVLTPTRQRLEKRERFHKSVVDLADQPHNVKMYYYIDSDDPEANNYLLQDLPGYRLDHIGDPISVSKSWNTIAELAVEDGCEVLIMGNDDMVYETQGWDTELRKVITEEFPDNIYCVWFQDGIKTVDTQCAFPIVSAEWFKTLGYFTPGVFHFGYNDTWIHEIGVRINRTKWITNVYTRHEHITRDWSRMDETYARVWRAKEGNLYDKDAPIWEATAHMREKDAQKLRDLIEEKASNEKNSTL